MESNELYINAIAAAARRGKEAEREKQAAVITARSAGVSWTPIGKALGISRQAARDKFLAPEQLAKAWGRIESLLTEIARGRNVLASTAEMVDRLVSEGSLSARDDADLRLILHRYAEAACGGSITTREAELLTDKAMHVAAELFLVRDKAN